MRVCILATCFLFGSCAESPVHPDSTQTSSTGTKTPTQILPASSSIRDGVFSYEQSRRGEAQYLEICERCHEKDLAGGGFVDEFIPSLVGDEFLSEWSPWSVADLLEFMTTEMPPKRKDRNGVTADTYVDILAYILEQNGFPAGQVELQPEFEQLSTIDMSLGR